MTPPVYETCTASSAVTDIVGTHPDARFSRAGDAPQGEAKPYATWQIIGGGPENYLGELPDLDSFTIQIDAYAKDSQTARNLAEALRDALESVAYVVSWRGEDRDKEAMLYRYSFDVEWMVAR